MPSRAGVNEAVASKLCRELSNWGEWPSSTSSGTASKRTYSVASKIGVCTSRTERCVMPSSKRLPIVLDASAEALPTMFCSAGRRGLEMELAPADLAALADARFAPIAG